MGNIESKVENPKADSPLEPQSSILGPRSSIFAFRLVWVVVLLAIVAGIGAYALKPWRWWSKAPEGDGQFNWQEAQRLIVERDLSEARTHLKLCLDQWPLNAEAHFLMARCSRRESDFARARVHLYAADRLQWPHEEIELESQLQQAQTGNLPAVEETLSNYLKNEHPDIELVFEALAEGYFVNNSSTELLNLTGLWLERSPDAWLPRLYRGHAYYLDARPKEAVEEYRRVLELNPDQEGAQIQLATSLMDDHQFQEALRLYQNYLQRNPDNFQALFGLANCEYSLGNTKAAWEPLKDLLVINPNDVRAIFLWAKLELIEERLEESLRWLRRAERLAPGEPDIIHTLIVVLSQLHQTKEVEKYQRRRQEIIDLRERLKNLRQKLRTDPNNASLRYQVGQVNLLLGHEEEAYNWFETALRIDPNHQEAQKALQELMKKNADLPPPSVSPPDAGGRYRGGMPPKMEGK